MEKKKHRFSAQRKANLLLLVSAVIFLAFYPYHKTLWGGLVSSFASAALIGGIADWFAIKSFFTKPLGISWPKALFRTDMIPANREEVISVIVDIIQDKVITKDALTQKIKEMEISKLLIDYIVEHKLLNSSAEIIIKNIDITSIKENQKYFKKLARKAVIQNDKEIYKSIAHLVDWTIDKGYVNSALTSATKELQRLLKTPKVYEKIDELFSNVKKRYSGNSMLNKVVTYVFSNIKDVPRELIQVADDKLDSIKDPEFIKQYDLAGRIEKFARYSTLTGFRKFINAADIKSLYAEAAATKTEGISTSNRVQDIIEGALNLLNTNLKENDDLRGKLISELDTRLSDFLYKNIEYIIKNKLAEYSNEMLTEEIYRSVGEDLNMVRLNGSLTGGMVGIITFIIMYIA